MISSDFKYFTSCGKIYYGRHTGYLKNVISHSGDLNVGLLKVFKYIGNYIILKSGTTITYIKQNDKF